MRAAVFVEPGVVRVEDRPESVAGRPTGALVRVTDADGSLVAVPGAPGDHSGRVRRSLLTPSDVMTTGHRAARMAEVGPGPRRSDWPAPAPSSAGSGCPTT